MRLSCLPARPRSRTVGPAYPVVVPAMGAIMAVAACGPSPFPVAQAPLPASVQEEAPATVAIVTSAPAAPVREAEPEQPAPAPPPADLLAGVAPPKFEEDNLDSFIGIGCGGGCPPAYVLETEHRDSRQVAARIKYCEKATRKHVPNLTGTLSVRAHIGVDGKARSVKVDASDSVPPITTACVATLVQTAVYSSKYNYAREAGGERNFEDKQREE